MITWHVVDSTIVASPFVRNLSASEARFPDEPQWVWFHICVTPSSHAETTQVEIWKFRAPKCVVQPRVGSLGAGVMYGWCLAYCTGVVLNTVRESATPDSKENKPADAGSRRFRMHFLCGALLCNFSSTEHEGLSTHHVQRECSAEPFMPSILSLGAVLMVTKSCTKILILPKIFPTRFRFTFYG